ncbi:MAG: hypothetical protein R3230_00605 [Nitrosopumilaceae archaeon]|nr:hypothetical protein [Nitrosopumilaceae archaeon]
MLELKEYIEIENEVALVNEAWYTAFDQETISQAEHFSLIYNPYTLRSVVRLVNDKYESLGEVEFESAEMAIAFLEEYFDLDDETTGYINSYDWADETKDVDSMNEALNTIEKEIERLADDADIRIRDIDDDYEIKNGFFGIAVYFDSKNNLDDLKSFVKKAERELTRTYGAVTDSLDRTVWVIRL